MNFNAISPLDQIEVEWLIFLSECPEIEELPSFSKRERQLLYTGGLHDIQRNYSKKPNELSR